MPFLWTLLRCLPLMWTLFPATALSANRHSCPSVECCLQWQLLRPMDTYMSSPLWRLLPTLSQSANGHFGVLSSIERCSQQQPYLPMNILVSFPRPSWPCASWPMSTGISFDYYHHRCQDFCSLHGCRLTLEERQWTQPRPCAQNLASLGAGMVASGSGLTCRVIP
jgi:hypothetical protein